MAVYVFPFRTTKLSIVSHHFVQVYTFLKLSIAEPQRRLFPLQLHTFGTLCVCLCMLVFVRYAERVQALVHYTTIAAKRQCQSCFAIYDYLLLLLW